MLICFFYRLEGGKTSSMTGDDGDANVMFAVWEPFIGHTVKVYCGYETECGTRYLDSLSIKVINEE